MMNWLKKVSPTQTNYTSNFVKKADYDTEIEKKMTLKRKCLTMRITTQEFNNLTTENLVAGLKQADLTSKNDIADLAKRQILMIKKNISTKKMTSNETRSLEAEKKKKHNVYKMSTKLLSIKYKRNC